jgi:hypothetical protein
VIGRSHIVKLDLIDRPLLKVRVEEAANGQPEKYRIGVVENFDPLLQVPFELARRGAVLHGYGLQKCQSAEWWLFEVDINASYSIYALAWGPLETRGSLQATSTVVFIDKHETEVVLKLGE